MVVGGRCLFPPAEDGSDCPAFFDYRPPNPGPRRVEEARAVNGPRDWVIVLSVAASMMRTDWWPSRWDAVRAAVGTFFQQLAAVDASASAVIVTYSDGACSGPGFVSVTDFHELSWDLGYVGCRGGTRIYSGLLLARSAIDSARQPGRIIFVADDHDKSDTSVIVLADQIVQRAVIDCVGIGTNPGDVDGERLARIASTRPDGSKRCSWIDNPAALTRYFCELAIGR